MTSVVSASVRPHRHQPTRLPRPWDSPGKNSGVGCHFLLQCMKVESESEVAQSCPTLSNPVDCSPPGSSVHGIFPDRVLEWSAIAFSDTHSTHSQIYIPHRYTHPRSSTHSPHSQRHPSPTVTPYTYLRTPQAHVLCSCFLL